MSTTTLSAGAPASALAAAGFDPDEIDANIKREIGRLTDSRIKLAVLRRRIDRLATDHDWPEGAELRVDSWSLHSGSLTVSIPFDADRPWKGLDGTAGIVYRVRRFFNCSHLTRSRISYSVSDPTTHFWATVQIDPDDERSMYYITIICQGQIPDSCHLEEVIDTTPRKSYKIVCGPSAPTE